MKEYKFRFVHRGWGYTLPNAMTMATIWLAVAVACMGVGIALVLNPPTPLRGVVLVLMLLACTHVACKQVELYANMARRLEEKEKEHDDA